LASSVASPYDRALALCPSDAARVELARLGAELGLGPTSQEWIVVVLYAESRRLFPGNRADHTREDDVDNAGARLSATAASLESSAKALAAMRSAAPPPPPKATNVQFRVPGIATATLLAIAACFVAVIAWFAGATTTAAQLRYANAAVATMLTTPAGHAAWSLLEANGDELPANLAACRSFVQHGRRAMECNLWAEPAGSIVRADSVLGRSLVWIASAPAWPLVIVLFFLAAISVGRARVFRSG